MISVIISSYRPLMLQALRENIASTIGVPYEIIAIANNNELSLSTAYNRGASNAAYPYLCFLHEDVKLCTEQWGRKMVDHLNYTQGLIGLAGSRHKTYLPTGWTSGMMKWDRYNVQHTQEQENSTKANRQPEAVSVMDGVLLAVSKTLWEKVKFDERIPGFHFYDIDFSLRLSQVAPASVVYDISLEHFSMGNFGDSWITASVEYHKKHKNTSEFFYHQLTAGEKNNIRNFWYRRLSSEKISLTNKLRFISAMGVTVSSLRSVAKFLNG